MPKDVQNGAYPEWKFWVAVVFCAIVGLCAFTGAYLISEFASGHSIRSLKSVVILNWVFGLPFALAVCGLFLGPFLWWRMERPISIKQAAMIGMAVPGIPTLLFLAISAFDVIIINPQPIEGIGGKFLIWLLAFFGICTLGAVTIRLILGPGRTST